MIIEEVSQTFRYKLDSQEYAAEFSKSYDRVRPFRVFIYRRQLKVASFLSGSRPSKSAAIRLIKEQQLRDAVSDRELTHSPLCFENCCLGPAALPGPAFAS